MSLVSDAVKTSIIVLIFVLSIHVLLQNVIDDADQPDVVPRHKEQKAKVDSNANVDSNFEKNDEKNKPNEPVIVEVTPSRKESIVQESQQSEEAVDDVLYDFVYNNKKTDNLATPANVTPAATPTKSEPFFEAFNDSTSSFSSF